MTMKSSIIFTGVYDRSTLNTVGTKTYYEMIFLGWLPHPVLSLEDQNSNQIIFGVMIRCSNRGKNKWIIWKKSIAIILHIGRITKIYNGSAMKHRGKHWQEYRNESRCGKNKLIVLVTVWSNTIIDTEQDFLRLLIYYIY